MSRVAGTLAAALMLVALTAGPALAHTRASSATNFDSRIVEAPNLDGVSWRLYPGGEYLEVENTSGRPLVVHGYDGEPYLRVGPGGVERNRNSPATYLNEERYADVAVPPRADPEAAPDWERLSGAPRHAWHDHRTHWMAPAPPPEVAAEPGTARHLHDWAVPFRHAGQAYEVQGALRWEPGPSWWPWLLAGLALTAPAAAGLRRRGLDALRPAAVVLAAVAVLNLAHLPDEIRALPLPALDVAFGIGHNLLFIGAGLAGAALAWRRTTSLLPLGIGAGAVAFHQGLLQVSQLGASQLPTAWPPVVVRLLVALSLAQALWTALVLLRARRPAAAHPEGGVSPPPAPDDRSSPSRRGRSARAARRPVAAARRG
jgi:hypothetical protein